MVSHYWCVFQSNGVHSNTLEGNEFSFMSSAETVLDEQGFTCLLCSVEERQSGKFRAEKKEIRTVPSNFLKIIT